MAVRKNFKLLKYEDIIYHFKARGQEIKGGQNPPGQNPPDKIPLDKIPLGQNPPGQNPPIISPQTVPLLNTFCFIEMLFSKASFLPPLLGVIYSMVIKWKSVAERSW